MNSKQGVWIIVVSTRGETGYLATAIRGYRATCGLTMNLGTADLYAASTAPNGPQLA